VAHALAGGTAFSVVGGGDTGAALHELAIPESGFGFVSTGGGASLEFVQGKALPGLDVLQTP
jgi:phosphoglycerate kinase